MILREMCEDDLGPVMEMEEDLFSPGWSRESFLDFLRRKDTLFLVAADDKEMHKASQDGHSADEKGNCILGYCGVLMVLDEGDVVNVAVRRDRQGEGIGSFLMRNLTELAARRGVKRLHLEVRRGNERAIGLYSRFGFRQDGLRRDYYTDPVEDAVLMTRE
ncbi:MAG: ribosomal protein S18-alanine N-acetyltransferase [Clostridiales bacterium]|nr:ribosomal protein S18-alanine N-acetyltransferase [Clostridiales bacterium]